jgi:flagellar hook-associated protein 2
VGFAQRVGDILKGAVRTTRDINGYKGTLVEKIGVDGDTSEVTNFIKTKLENMEDKIKKSIEMMKNKEEYYWDQFTYMETVISRLNSQSESLYGMFSV